MRPSRWLLPRDTMHFGGPLLLMNSWCV
jgi:hypothetical protein